MPSKDPIKKREAVKRWKQKNKDKVRQEKKEYRTRHKAKIVEYHKERRKKLSIEYIKKGLKRRLKNKGIDPNNVELTDNLLTVQRMSILRKRIKRVIKNKTQDGVDGRV